MDNKSFYLYKKYIKPIAGLLASFFIFYGIYNLLNYMYVSPTDSNWERILWHGFYENKGNIDNVYIGSSHVFFDINPEQLDEMNGQFNFNLASSSQQADGSYYLLKEADRNNSLSHVYLELYHSFYTKNCQGLETIDTFCNSNWKNMDYMQESLNKLEYMLSIADSEKYMDIFFPFSRYRMNLDNWKYINDTIEGKQKDDYLAFKFCDELNEFRKQGYWYSDKVFSENERIYEQSTVLCENSIGEKSEKYLRKFITYCQQRNLPLTLFISPIDELPLISTEDYDSYVCQIRELSQEYGVAFYDFNLAKKEYLPLCHEDSFFNLTHLNAVGANVFTPFFYKVVSKTETENRDYFYNSYKEKLQDLPPAIYGLYYKNLGKSCIYKVASNREEGMEYRITITPDLEEPGQTVRKPGIT